MADQAKLIALTAAVVAAHLRKNTVPVDQAPALINDILQALAGLGSEDQEKLTPTVPIKRSIRKSFTDLAANFRQ